jgi:LEA14-like dessication related protein
MKSLCIRPALLAGILLVVLCSCSTYRNVEAPTVSGISAFKAGKLQEGRLPLSFNTTIKNPDRLSFKIKRVDLELLVAGTRIAEIKSNRKVRIRRQLEHEMHWEVTAELAPMLKQPGKLLKSIFTGRPQLEISGTMTVRKLFWTRTVPVKLRIPVELPIP